MNFIQTAITFVSGLLAVSFLVVILLAEATTEEDIVVTNPPASVSPMFTGGDKITPPRTTVQKTTRPYFPILYHFFHPQTVKK